MVRLQLMLSFSRGNSECLELLLNDDYGNDVARALMERGFAIPNLEVYSSENMLTLVD